MSLKKQMFLLIGASIGLVFSSFVYSGSAIKINYSNIDLDTKTIKIYGIGFNSFGPPTITIGDTILTDCSVGSDTIECPISNTPAESGGSWRVRISAGNSPHTNDHIDVFIPVGLSSVVCTPGDFIQCYSGPPSTMGVGTCIAGVRTCSIDGTWSPCQGEIVPQLENCYDGIDNDCNGVVDNDCADPCDSNPCGPNCTCNNMGDGSYSCDCLLCSPGETRSCYDGNPGTEGVGVCKTGTQTCSQDGSSYGTCEGQILPNQEVCDGLDNDCDGITDNGSFLCGPYLCQGSSGCLVSCISNADCVSPYECHYSGYCILPVLP